MADLDLYCNFKKCRRRLTHFAWVTRCSHAFCDEDGNKEFLKSCESNDTIQRKCPACGMQLPKPYDIVKVDLDPSEEFKSMVLAGLRPEIAADIMGRSLTFWNYQIYQQQLYQEASTKQYRNSLAEVEKYYENAIHKIQTTLKHRDQVVKEVQQALEVQTKLNADLKEKLTAKTRQAHKSQQLYESLRRNTLSASMADDIHEPRNYQYENGCGSQHKDCHQKLHPKEFPFIQPQIIQNPPSCPRTSYNQHVCEDTQGVSDFTFKPVTPNVSSAQGRSGRSFSKRPRVSQTHFRRPHN